jgi:hypothetical protein
MNIQMNIIKYWRILLLIAGTILLLTSCEEKINLNLDDTYTRIVVDGEITTETKAHKVILMKSAAYFSNQSPPPVTGAVVAITDGSNVIPLMETPAVSVVYLTAPDVKGIVGRTYKLIIQNVDINGDGDIEMYEASCLLKQVFPLDSIKSKVFKEDEIPRRYLIDGYGQEPASIGDYYLWKYYKNNKIETDSLFEWIFTDDLLVNGKYIPGLSMFLVEEAVPGDTIKVESRSITKEYYDFLNAIMLETYWNGGGFSGPPANIKGNVSNGGQGFFLATDVGYSSTTIQAGK